MDKCARYLLLPLLLLCCCKPIHAVDSRFDLIGPKIDVRVTRDSQTLPIAAVPNLEPGDKLWIHPDLPSTQSVRYLLICVFLRGNTNPPPDDWFFRIQTWDHKIREEGTFITVPADAQQAVLFLAPETGGDFSTIRSTVRGRPGAFVRASQDLIDAGFEEARIEKYIASIRRVPPSDAAELLKHSDLLARTLALKPNVACFSQPVDMQFTCLTQSGAQIVLDNGNGKTVADALNGPTSDLISQASYSPAAAGGLYSAYVGAIVDVVRIMSNLHTAQFQYIPAISSPHDDAMNLRLNTPPSFHNPKSVLVIALPAVQAARPPALRPAAADEVTCLIKPSVVLPIDGAPLVFSTDFAHDLTLHLNTPPGAPAEPDISLTPDAYFGGLVLQKEEQHHIPLQHPALLQPASAVPNESNLFANPSLAAHKPAEDSPARPQPKPVLLTGVIKGRWGFDAFTGPTVELQQLPGTNWTIVPSSNASKEPTYDLVAGHTAKLLLNSSGSACVHTITAHPSGDALFPVPFKSEPRPDQPNLVALTLPLEHDLTPGDLHLEIQQYDQPKADELSARTFSEPSTVAAIELHANDKTLVVTGTRLGQIEKITLGDLVFSPAPDASYDTQPSDSASPGTLHFALPANAPAPPTHINENLTASISLRDGRSLFLPLTISAPRPVIVLLRKSVLPDAKTSNINLSNPDDLPLTSLFTFTLKSPDRFPRNGQVEIETLDGTLRTVLTLAPSGGLLLQDPRTIVATLDPLRSFGPSAFGALRLRAIYPMATSRSNDRRSEPASGAETTTQPDTTAAADLSSPASDWLPLVTLVRLPTLTQLQCPTEITQSCTITGNNFFLLEAISSRPDFSEPVPVPDGYTGTSLTIPHPAAATIFFKLRDDPSNIDSAVLTVPAPPVTSHVRRPTRTNHGEQDPSEQESPETAAPTIPSPAAPGTTTPAPSSQPTSRPVKPESPASGTQSSPSTTPAPPSEF